MMGQALAQFGDIYIDFYETIFFIQEVFIMKYRTLETMRQTRLMITEVVIPLTLVAATVYHIPAVKEVVNEKVDKVIKRHKEKKASKIVIVS